MFYFLQLPSSIHSMEWANHSLSVHQLMSAWTASSVGLTYDVAVNTHGHVSVWMCVYISLE